MKRWLVVLIVVLALIVLISPGILGRFAEKNIDESIAWTEADSPGVSITTETFERGWFTSAGRHRVVLDGAQFHDASEKYTAATGNAMLPSLIIDTRLDHGLVPVTSLGRDEGSLLPGLASTVSRFLIDPGSGDPVEVPGALYSNVGLTGASDSHLLLEPGSVDLDGAYVQWQGTDITLHADPASRGRAIDGTIKSVRLNADELTASFESLSITADQSPTDYGFNVGRANVLLSGLTLGSGDDTMSIASMGITANSDIENARVSGRTSFTIKSLTAPTGDVVDVDLLASIDGFDAQALGFISAALKAAQGNDDPQTALTKLFPSIEGDLQTLLRRGMQFDIERLEVSLPQGVISTVVAVDVAEMEDDAKFSWPRVLLNMTASVDVRLPMELFDMAVMMNPEAGSLVAMGILQKDGTDYVMDAEYAKGLVNVNGAPMPVPIPGLQ